MDDGGDSAGGPSIDWNELGSLCEELGAEHVTLARTRSAVEAVEKSLSAPYAKILPVKVKKKCGSM